MSIDNQISVSIIIPIYNVSKYIERCAVSLFEQTIDDIEYVFVNDCTPDNSMQILQKVMERYPGRKSNIKIINHDENRGLAAARNTGVAASSGIYIAHCDSDDWIEKDMYEALYEKAENDNADIVISDFYRHMEGIRKISKQQPKLNTPHACIKELFLGGSLSWAVWNKLIKRRLYVEYDIKAIEGADMGEDMCTVLRLFAVAEKISYLPTAYYHYSQNSSSMTQNMSIKKVEGLLLNVQNIIDFFKNKNIFKQFVPCIYFWTMGQKDYIFKLDSEYWTLWNKTLPIPLFYILISPKINLKRKVFYILVKCRMWWLIKK